MASIACPQCGTSIESPSDPTARTAVCPHCATRISLAQLATMARPSEESAPSSAPPASAPTASSGPQETHSTGEVVLADPGVWVGRTVAGFHIEAMIGGGGMGWVYRARQLSLSRPVALKLLHPRLLGNEDFIARFVREARTLAALDHPGIVNVIDAGIDGGVAYIAMAYVQGPEGEPLTLKDIMDRGTLAPGPAAQWLIQVCDALEWAHKNDIVHRDLKPGNILIGAQGQARIADFGIARSMSELAPSAGGLTVTGAVMGTIEYMAPEQLRDSKRVDHRADIYALGVMLYEMLTGHPPAGRFDLPSEVDPKLDPRFDRVVDRALKRAPEHRYASVGDMRAELVEIVRDVARGTAPAPPQATAMPAAAPLAQTATTPPPAPPGGAPPPGGVLPPPPPVETVPTGTRHRSLGEKVFLGVAIGLLYLWIASVLAMLIDPRMETTHAPGIALLLLGLFAWLFSLWWVFRKDRNAAARSLPGDQDVAIGGRHRWRPSLGEVLSLSAVVLGGLALVASHGLEPLPASLVALAGWFAFFLLRHRK